MTNPIDALRADIEVLHPLERARRAGAKEDASEEYTAGQKREAKREEADASLAQRVALDRIQLAQRGYTDSELGHFLAGQDAAKRDEIAELEAKLTKLDPQRGAVKRAGTQAAENDQRLEEARRLASDPFMRAELERFHQARGGGGEARQRREDMLERARELGYGVPSVGLAYISR